MGYRPWSEVLEKVLMVALDPQDSQPSHSGKHILSVCGPGHAVPSRWVLWEVPVLWGSLDGLGKTPIWLYMGVPESKPGFPYRSWPVDMHGVCVQVWGLLREGSGEAGMCGRGK